MLPNTQQARMQALEKLEKNSMRDRIPGLAEIPVRVQELGQVENETGFVYFGEKL